VLEGQTCFCMDSSVPVWPDNKSCQPEGFRFVLRCALPLFVVWSVVVYSLLIYHCISLALKVYASTSHTTLEGVLRGRSFCVVVGVLLDAFHCAVFFGWRSYGDHTMRGVHEMTYNR
jgi:hypothetical protein